ncbi:MAG: hypothetical protein E7644_02585 [Ruminococcaceae bacterium]|nr:hypothetical protein [Oscillospiraceae bacterium]
MAQITEKELSALGDLLTLETTLQKKCECMAAEAGDAGLTQCYQQMAAHHQRHVNELYDKLK